MKTAFYNLIQQTQRALIVALLSALALGLPQSSQAGSNEHFKELNDLQALAERSQQSRLPIMLMFGAEWCEYCQELTEQVFAPMAMSGIYDDRVVHMRHVGVDEHAPIPGVDGELIKKEEWAYRLNADLTPTVLFLNGNGQEVAPRIVGVSNTHLYAGLIHQKLNIAYRNMGNPFRLPATPEQYLLQLQAQ